MFSTGRHTAKLGLDLCIPRFMTLYKHHLLSTRTLTICYPMHHSFVIFLCDNFSGQREEVYIRCCHLSGVFENRDYSPNSSSSKAPVTLSIGKSFFIACNRTKRFITIWTEHCLHRRVQHYHPTHSTSPRTPKCARACLIPM